MTKTSPYLRPDGVGEIRFGTPELEAKQALDQMFVSPGESHESSCGSGERTSSFVYEDDIVFGFVEGKFTSWVVLDGSTSGRLRTRIQTADGIQLGQNRSDLLAGRDQMERSTVFSDGSFRMTLSVAPDGTVYEMSARALGWGQCAFRDI